MQGVGFRAWTARSAEAEGIVGWVRNLPDGTVETYFEGETAQLEQFCKLLHQGPRYSQVDCVAVTEEGELGPEQTELFGFEIRR